MKKHPLLITGSVLVAAWMTTGAGMAQSSPTIHPDVNKSVGGSKSERSGDAGVPLPKGSRYSGTVEKGSSNSTSSASSATENEGERSSSASNDTSHRGSKGQIKEVQQALKEKGYNPGPVDGVIGAHTKEAIKSFQSASNLEATGTLNSETREKLGVQSGSSANSSSSSSGSMKSHDKSSNTSVDKEPSPSSSKNR